MKKYQEEIKALLQKAERSLNSAKLLRDAGDYDFAGSRAYYSMFYCATAILLTKDLKFSKHTAVISFFGKEFIKTGLLPEKLYSYIIEAFSERQKGDYEIIFMQSLERTSEIIEKAEEFIKECEKFLKSLGYEI
ncbi:MAG: HEPN domain-containing protein [Bacteroidota bacterium]